MKVFLGDLWKFFINLIVEGKIKGVVVVVGCLNMIVGGYDVNIVEFIKELIKKDIIVLFVGCFIGGLENVGFMLFGVEELVGENLKEVCKILGILLVLNFGLCLVIGRLEIVVIELVVEFGIDLL